MEVKVKDSGLGFLFLLPSGHGCHCSLRQPLSSSSPCLQQQPLHQTQTSLTAATASSACKIISWAISPTLIILGCCLLRLVLKLIQDIIYTISCKVRPAFFFYHFCQRCTNKPSAGKGIIVFMEAVIMLVTPATLLGLLPVTHKHVEMSDSKWCSTSEHTRGWHLPLRIHSIANFTHLHLVRNSSQSK